MFVRTSLVIILFVHFCSGKNITEENLRKNVWDKGVVGDTCKGDNQCFTKMCYEGKCSREDCSRHGQRCVTNRDCCSSVCRWNYRCDHRYIKKLTGLDDYPDIRIINPPVQQYQPQPAFGPNDY